MADEEKTPMEAGDNPSSEASAAPKGGKSKLILLGGVGLGAVVIGLVVALFVIKPMMSDSPGDQTEEYAEETGDSHGESADVRVKEKPKPKKKPKSSQGDSGDKSEALIYAIKDIVVNPAGTGGSRFLSVSLGFEMESSEFLAEFQTREAIVRDALITILSSKTVAQLTDAKQKEIARYQIKKRVSKLLNSEEIIGVYFTDFVLQ
jgi:flagellar FliL protein